MSDRPDPPEASTSSPRPGEPTFLTVSEVADLMRLSKMSVYRMIHAGELEAVRFGHSFRVPTQAVTTYLRNAQYRAG